MINKLLNKAKEENIELEIFKDRNKCDSITVYNDNLDKFDSSDITTFNIKALYNNKTIYLKSDNINDIDYIIDLIKEQSKLIENDDINELATTKNKIKVSLEEDKINYSELINNLISLYDLKKQYSNLVSITSEIESIYTEYSLYNENVSLEDKNKYYCVVFEVVMNFNGVNKTHYQYFYFKKLDFNKIKKITIDIIEEIISKNNITSIDTEKYNILLDNRCVSKLLNKFSSMFSAERINKKLSILTDRLNEKVFSDKITIIEDPQNDSYVGKRLFDTEGTETFYKIIVENGIFKTKLYNNKTALKENIKSTGNSFGVRNMHIKPGEKSKEELLEQLNNGIYITNIEGLHAGVNTTTGDISLMSEGYIIKDGKKDKYLEMIVLSSNIFEILNNIEEIGNDLQFDSLSCGAPSLLLNDITVAGDK